MISTPGDRFRDQVAAQVRQQACQLILDGGAWSYILSRIFRNLDWSPNFSFFQTLHHQFCGEPLFPFEPPVGWRGGQCPVLYDVYVEWEFFNATATPPVTEFRNALVTVLGPIEFIGWEKLNLPPGPFESFEGFVRAQPRPGQEDGKAFIAGVTYPTGDRPYFTRIEVIRQDGGPDNCGPPAPPPPPPPTLDFRFPLVWVGPNNVEFSVDARATVGFAYIDADANINLPFNITIPVSISPTINVPFTFNIYFNFGTGDFIFRPPGPPRTDRRNPPGAPRPPADPPIRPDGPDPPPSDNPGDPPPPPDAQGKERRITAALIRATDLSGNRKASQIYQQQAPDIYAPNLGYVSFQIRLSTGETCWTADIPVKNANQLIPCPWQGGAVAVSLNAIPGVDIIAIPLYSESDDWYDLFNRRV